MESGKPVDVIINAAAHERAGLIVLGQRGLGRLKRTFTSTSVSDHVLHRAHCPVVICRNGDATTAAAGDSANRNNNQRRAGGGVPVTQSGEGNST